MLARPGLRVLKVVQDLRALQMSPALKGRKVMLAHKVQLL